MNETMEKYTQMREAYIQIGGLLRDNVLLSERILQNQEEIKKTIQKGWGYK